jgi:superfamily II DNA or RNA helicase
MPHQTDTKATTDSSLPVAPILSKLTLFPFQKEAVKKMRSYLTAYSQKKTRRAGLVYMPTGTGKTAVIAALTMCIPDTKIALILVPRTALRDQTYNELKGNIFTKLNLPSDEKLKPVYRLDEKQQAVDWFENIPEEAVLVSTIQKLESLQKTHRTFFDILTRKIDFIIFDEGHYEPSLHWSDTVRGITKPRIVFTATPFRNDLKNFDIDPDHGYVYSFHKAVAQHYVRSVNITDVTPKDPLDATEFVTHIMKFYTTYSEQKLLRPDARIIIRCDDASQISHIADALSLQVIPYVAIHDTFEDGDENGTRWKHVPDLKQTEALVWIHQYKLIEGIDDQRFQLLAIFGKGHDSARPLIQQIGRIIRNPERDPNSKAYVLDTIGGILKNQWAGYLEHDKYIENNGLTSLDPNVRFQQMLHETQMPVDYINRSFRMPFSLYGIKPEIDIQLPLKTTVLYKNADISMWEVAKKLSAYLQENDCYLAEPDITDERCIILSVRRKYSPYLTESYFVESRLCVTLIRLAGNYVCYYDSDNLSLNSYVNLGDPVPSSQLRKLLSEMDLCKIKQVSLINSRINPDTVQRRSLQTNSSMERTPPAFDDPNYVCTSTEAFLENTSKEEKQKEPGIRRYIGFNSARLRDGSWTKYYHLTQYELWLDKIVRILTKRSIPPIQGLSRYAMITKPPVSTRPVITVLDPYEIRDLYITTKLAKNPGQPVDIYQDENNIIVENDKIKAQVNGQLVEDIIVRYDSERSKYVLCSPQLDKLCEPIEHISGGIINRFNKDQAFRVVPESSYVIYSAGAFHDSQIGLGRKYKEQHHTVLSTIYSFSIFNKITSEKGKEKILPGDLSWEENSLFGLIDRLGGEKMPRMTLDGDDQKLATFFHDVELLVCDDMGTELADFIMIQSMSVGRKNVIFIHCKALDLEKKTKLSASGLAEVCSQAIKNLGELDNYSQSAVDRKVKWSKPWVNGKLGTIEPRIRTGGNSKSAWKYLRETIENPNTRRETWLFLGNLLSKSELEKRLEESSEKSLETLQAFYELYSTLCTVRSRDSGLYIFCNP